ncbi:hypothetical protein ABEB36_000392 [Hypothenemus hampei]|uniref:HTH psq-type domain-containing protein n=1 Tax=Hypothenemus hampei TaxID=57062 RepID=A0ABD1FEP6_HYPHA
MGYGYIQYNPDYIFNYFIFTLFILWYRMVRTYKRKTARQSWSTESMEMAVEAILKGEMGYKKASTTFRVPSSTLERYVKKKRENAESVIDKTIGKFKSTFTVQQEKELVSYLIDMQRRLFGITMKELRQFAFQLAENNSLPHNFNKNTGMAGVVKQGGYEAKRGVFAHPI